MEDRRQKYRTRDMERIKRLRLLDDVFMKVVLDGNIQGVQDIIRVVLKREDIAVLEVRTQKELSNLVGHSVRIDVLAKDTAGRYYNIEIQRAESGAEEKRARYNLGAVDWHTLPAGADYGDLAETWVIFITETDVWKAGLPVYTVNRYIEETKEKFEDKGHIVYVNGSYQADDEIGLLMADFRETDPKKMHYRSLGDRAQYYKNTEGGTTSMCRVMEEVRAEGVEEGIERGRVEGRADGRVEGRAEGRAEGRMEERNRLIDALVLCNSEESLLHGSQFAGLNITQSEIDASRKRLAV